MSHGYASAAEVIRDGLRALLPPDRMSVDEWAAEERYLSNPGGGFVGKWDHAQAPYTVAPMRDLTNPLVDTVVVVGPGQSAKTSIAENWKGQSVTTDPASFLWYMPTDEMVDAYVKEDINKLIDMHDGIKSRLGLKPVDDSLSYKRFRGMSVQFLAAKPNNFINKKAGRIVCDEIDSYAASLGDLKTLVDVRRTTFGSESKLLLTSHPDRGKGMNPDQDWTTGIMSYYGISNRHVWYWPCPHCNGFSSPNPFAKRYMPVHYDEDAPIDEIADMARLVCPCCGSEIEDGERFKMNQHAKWVGRGQTIHEDGTIEGELTRNPIAGYWIVGPMSTLAQGGIGKLAADRVRAERATAITGDDEGLRQVVVKQWGLPYKRKSEGASIEVAALIERATGSTSPWRKVASDVRCLMAAIDLQQTWFEVLVRGYCDDRSSRVVDHFKVFQAPDGKGGYRQVDPFRRLEDWRLLVETVLTRVYPLEDDPTRGMQIRGRGYDSAGGPGATARAYSAWRMWRRDKLATRHGRSRENFDLWTILPTKGMSPLDGPKLRIAYPDTNRRDRKVSAQGAVPVGQFNPNKFKDDLSGQLMRAEPGDGFVHFPKDLLVFQGETSVVADEQPFFEQFGAEERDKSGRWEKTGSTRNEAIDLMVITDVMAMSWGVPGIDWANPPAWAKPHDENPLVVPIEHSDTIDAIDDDAEVAFTPHTVKSDEERRVDFKQLARERARRLNQAR